MWGFFNSDILIQNLHILARLLEIIFGFYFSSSLLSPTFIFYVFLSDFYFHGLIIYSTHTFYSMSGKSFQISFHGQHKPSGVKRCSGFPSISVLFHRRSEEEVDMDKVTAAMVLTSLSTSPLVRSPPVKVSGELNVRQMQLQTKRSLRVHRTRRGCFTPTQ